jgi:SAM-dependent methyltransferase
VSQAHYARIAALYDAFVNTDFDIEFFTSQAHEQGDEILELMAGTGRLTIPIVRAGFRVTALDFSAEMLQILQHKLEAQGLSAELHQADIRSFSLGKQYKQIWIPFHAFPELISEADQTKALERIHAHLLDEGVFICTLHNPIVREKSVDGQMRLVVNRELASGNKLLVWLLQTRHSETNIVEVHEFFEEYNAHGVMISKQYSPLQFHLLSKPAFERLFTQAGFEVLKIYGNYDHSAFDEEQSQFLLWVLKKHPGKPDN